MHTKAVDYVKARQEYYAFKCRLIAAGCHISPEEIEEGWKEFEAELRDHELNDKQYRVTGKLVIEFDETVIARNEDEAKDEVMNGMDSEYFCCFDEEDYEFDTVEVSNEVIDDKEE